MESLGGGIRDIINKTKHSVCNKWRTFMKKSKFRFEQHFGRTEEVIFKSELEAKNKELKVKVYKLSKENRELKIILSESFIEDVRNLSFNFKSAVITLYLEVEQRNKEIKKLNKENKELKREIRKLKEVKK